MMRSLFSGVAGLKNHQTRMDVIGNNIANVNTIGYKASRVTFEDMLSQTLQGASSAGNGQGGTNPMQVGLGSAVASIDTIFTDGSTQSTGKQTDMAISGNGFFILQVGSNEMYTRAGDFDFDEVGNLVVPGSGYRVMGWNADSSGVINTGGSLSPIVISPTKVMPPKASTSIDYSGNLAASAGVGSTAQTSIDTFDSLGEKHKVTQNYLKTGDNTWLFTNNVANGTLTSGKYGIMTFKADGTVDSIKDINMGAVPTATVTFSSMSLNNTAASTGTSYFTAADSSGTLHVYKMTMTNTTPYVAGTTDGTWSYTISDAADTTNASLGTGTITCNNGSGNYSFSPASVTLNGNSVALAIGTSTVPTAGNTSMTASLPYTVGTSLSDLAITPANSAAAMTVSLASMNNITQYGGSDTSTVTAIDQDGYTSGTLQKKTVDSSGTITGTFSNGETMKLGQVALATFSNPAGLTKAGDSLYEKSNNSGEPQRGAAGDGGRGKISASSLEMSNVDLSQEFSDMIVTQRGFQANSKIITTSDEMLEILANLKR